MKKKNPLAPILPALSKLDDLELEDELTVEGVCLSNQELSYQDHHDLLIKEAVFKRITMHRNHFSRFECSNVRFEHCDFSNTEWIGGSFHQVEFIQCKLTGANFAESYLRDCLFNDCLADYASFSSANLQQVQFEKTSLIDSEFYELTWKNLIIEHTNLSGSNWMRTSLQGLDFTSDTFETLLFSPEKMKGLTVTPEQGLLLASALGLIIA